MANNTFLSVVVIVLVASELVFVVESGLGSKRNRRPLQCHSEPKKCVKAYQNVNNLLEKYVRSNDVPKNMATIQDWIRLRIESDPEAENWSEIDMDSLSALVLINELSQIDGKGQCKPSTAKTLQNNDLALRGALAKGDKSEPKTRLVRILKHYVKKYFDKCDYKHRLEQFNPRQLADMKAVVGELIGINAQAEFDIMSMFEPKVEDHTSYVSERPMVASSFANRNMKWLGSAQDAAVTVALLKQFAKRDNVQLPGPLSEELNVRPLFKRYVLEPCEDYVECLNSVFSNKWTLWQSVKYHRKAQESAGLHEHLAYYYGCSKVLKRRRDLSAAMAELEKSEESKNW